MYHTRSGDSAPRPFPWGYQYFIICTQTRALSSDGCDKKVNVIGDFREASSLVGSLVLAEYVHPIIPQR